MHSVRFPGGSTWQLNQGYGHGERIFDVAFHPFSEDVVLTASEDSSVRMWRRADGSAVYKQVRAFLGHKAEALRACWSANGLLLASGSADRTVRLWAADLEGQDYTGRELAVLDGHPEEVYYVEFVDPAARPLNATAVRQHAASSGGNAGGAVGPPPPLPPFETHVMVASCESLFVWSLQEGAVVQQADAPGTSGSTITQDAIRSGVRPAYIFGVSRQPAGGAGSLVAAACCDGVVRLWSLRPTGHLEWAGQLALPGQPMLTGCAFSDDGSLLGVCSREGRLMELDVRMLELVSSRPLPASPLAVTYLPPPPPLPLPLPPPPPLLPPPSGGDGAAPRQGLPVNTRQRQQQQQEEEEEEEERPMWLVACRDGAVYGYEPGQRGGAGGGGGGGAGEPRCVMRPPLGPGVSVLALAAGPGFGAVALGGEPQDAALLPPLHPSPSPSPPAGTAAKPIATAAAAAAEPSPAAATQPSSGPAAASAATGDRGGGGGDQTQPQSSQPSSSAREGPGRVAVAAAPPRRRGGGGTGRVVVDPLALLNDGNNDTSGGGGGGGGSTPSATTACDNQTADAAATGNIGGRSVDGGCSADVVAGDLAAMALEKRQPTASRAVGAQQQQQQQDDPMADGGVVNHDRSEGGTGPDGATTAHGVASDSVADPVAAAATAVQEQGPLTGLSGRTRAPLFVYRRAT